MNIFILDLDVKKCAKYHCNKHVVKMLTESAQLLCSAYYYTNESHKSPYKLAHKHHPCEVPNLPDKGLTPFAQAMPGQYQNDDVVKAYRDYYIGDKKHILQYKNRNVPEWLEAV